MVPSTEEKFISADVLDLTRQLKREPDIDTALKILQWELGDLAKATTYAKWHPGKELSYKAEARLAMASLLFQARVVCALLDIDFADTLLMGVMIVEDRIVDLESKRGRMADYVGDGPKGLSHE